MRVFQRDVLTLGLAEIQQIDAKETTRCKLVLVVTELNYFYAKKSTCCSPMLNHTRCKQDPVCKQLNSNNAYFQNHDFLRYA